jgi:hypothetical protein
MFGIFLRIYANVETCDWAGTFLKHVIGLSVI